MNNSPPKVAVALAAYNGTAYIAEQVDSILNQTGVEVTIFASIDASSDETEAWFERLAKVEFRVKLLTCGEVFGSAAPNFLRLIRNLNLEDFDYLSFSDQDDIWDQNKLIRAHRQMTAHEANGYSSNVTAFWSSGKKRLIKKSQPQKEWDHFFEAAGPGCTYVVRRNLACALQFTARQHRDRLSRLRYHDWFIYAFARINGHRWIIDEHPTLLYRQHATNQVGVNMGWKPFLKRVQKICTGEALGQATLIAQVSGLPMGHPVINLLKGGRIGMLRLALKAPHCRRKRIEQVFFFFSCVMAALWTPSRRLGE